MTDKIMATDHTCIHTTDPLPDWPPHTIRTLGCIATCACGKRMVAVETAPDTFAWKTLRKGEEA